MVLPVDCNSLSNVICMKIPTDMTQMMVMYCVPYLTISGSLVCAEKNACEQVMPITANTIQLMMPRKIPLRAARLAPLKFFSPKFLDSNALIPTPVPDATEIIKVWIGNASDTAVRASSHSLATNMLSTMLYRACTSMEIIIGRDIEISSLGIGMMPILFSVCTV